MAYPGQPIREQYVNHDEINIKTPIPQHPRPYHHVAPAWLSTISTKNTSEGLASVACSSSKAARKPLRRLSVVANFEEIPQGPASSRSDYIEDSFQKSNHSDWTIHEPRSDRKIKERCLEYDLSIHHSFQPAWWESSHNPAVGFNTATPTATTPMTESFDQLSDFQDADCESEGEEACYYSPRIIKPEGSRRHLKASHHQDQNFITPKISLEETPGEIRDDLQTRIEDSLTQGSNSIIQISDSDLESFQSISEPESDSESWVNEPTIAELEDKLQTSDHRLKEVSPQLEANLERNRAQNLLTEMRLYREHKELLATAKNSPAVEVQASRLSRDLGQEDSLANSTESSSKPERYTSSEIPCYCQGDPQDDEFRVPLPVLKIQLRNLRQQINEISEERKHYKETRERLQDQFYSVIRRKQEFLPEQQNTTILMLKRNVTALEKTKGDLIKCFNKLRVRNAREKKHHDTVIASYAANYDSLLTEHTQLKEEFQSLAKGHTDAQQAKLNQDELHQKIDNLKELIVDMSETQTTRFRVLETQVCSICCGQKTIPSPNTEISATTLDNTELTAGLSTTTFEKSRYDLLLQAYVELEQEHHKSEKIQSGLEETVSKHQLTIEDILLENEQYHDRIVELTQLQNSNTLQAQPLPSNSFFSSSPPPPSTLFDNDMTCKTIAKLNHKLTSENTRLIRIAESDATIIACQSEKLNQLTQRCARASNANEQLTRELTTLRTAHLKLEKAHAIAQEAYKVLERSAAESNLAGIASGGVPVGAAAENPLGSQRLGFMHGKGKEVDQSQKNHLMPHAALLTSGTAGRNGTATRMVTWVAEPEVPEGWGEGRREDDYATPGNSDVEY